MMSSPASPEMSVSVADRRRRLVARHHLDGQAPDVSSVLRSVVGMHATDPATPHLATLARMRATADAKVTDDGFGPLAAMLHTERRAWRLHAMRRTLFVIDLTDANAVHGGASREIAQREHRKFARWLHDSDVEPATITGATSLVRDTLATAGPMSVRELVAASPALGAKVTVGSGRWTAQQSIASRALLVLALDGAVTRAGPVGTWLSGQFRWAWSPDWFGDRFTVAATAALAGDAPTARALRSALVARYLTACGPATVADVAWWTGWSATKATQALADNGALPVTLEGSQTVGYLSPSDPLVSTRQADQHDSDHDQAASPAVALLPALDPTPMSYRDRAWYLGAHAPALFDRNGNVGPTIWVDGRIVGGWGQRSDGRVVTELLERLPRSVQRQIEAEQDALTDALQATVVTPRFRTPLERSIADR